MNHIKTVSVAVISCVLGISLAWAHIFEDEPSDAMNAYIYRDSVMHVISAQRTILRNMADGKTAMNDAEFIRAANHLAMLLAIVPDAFKPNMTVDESLASPDIWSNWDDFVSKAEGLRNKVREIADVASSRGAESAKGMVEDISCGSCHRPYKIDLDD